MKRGYRLLARYLFFLLFLGSQMLSVAQEEGFCAIELDSIRLSYNNGQWQIARDRALHFLQDSIHTGLHKDLSPKIGLDPTCSASLPQAFYYLIKASFRLGEIDNGRRYYLAALRQDIDISYYGDANQIKKYFDSISAKKTAMGINLGITTSTAGSAFTGSFEMDFGKPEVGIGYVNAYFDDRLFDHVSNQRPGTFGRSLRIPANAVSQYSFDISGSSGFVGVAAGVKLPFAGSSSSRFNGYLLEGAFISYYLYSDVHDYKIIKVDSAIDTTVYVPAAHANGQRLTFVPGLNMDLTSLYASHWSIGGQVGLEIDMKLGNSYAVSFKAMALVGTNYSYAYRPFNSFKPGVSYSTFTFGIRKVHYKINNSNHTPP